MNEPFASLPFKGLLDEPTFWQIVRTEKERTDRCGLPVTVAIFTSLNAAIRPSTSSELCSVLRSVVRDTDHVGVAGQNKVGVVLWGTREAGADRFLSRLSEKTRHLDVECRLFVYPLKTGENVGSECGELEDLLSCHGQPIGLGSRVSEEEFDEGFGEDSHDSFGVDLDDAEKRNNSVESSTLDFARGNVATLPAPSKMRMKSGRLSDIIGAKTWVHQFDRRSRSSPDMADAAQTENGRMNVIKEPLENLFMLQLPGWKRCMDVSGSIFGLVVLSPVFLVIAGLIKLTSPGPILFRQTREGHGGRLFTILKFRTMRVGADAEKAALRAGSEQDGPAFKMEHDPRVTPIGGFLRKTCLDELPQLWNVLVAEMTLVGPRPLDYRESRRISRWGRRRLYVKPGLTCTWQVYGKSKVSFDEWMRMDLRYAKRITLWHDVRLILTTLKQVLLGQASR